MKKLLTFFFIIFLLPAGNFLLQAQAVRKFSDEPEKFITEMSTLMNKGNSAKSKLVMEKFTVIFNSNAYTRDEKSNIIYLSNLLLKKRARANPHFLNYLQTVIAIKNIGLPEKDILAWFSGAESILKNNTISVNKANLFFVNSDLLFEKNILYKSNAAAWKISPKKIGISFDHSLRYKISNTDLTCYAQKDSIQIFGTSGVFDPVKNIWIGKGGKVTWEHAGFSATEVYALLNNYTLNMTKSGYQADSIKFTNTKYFNQPLEGLLIDKVKKVSNPSRATYPVFKSYKQRFSIKNIYPGIDYEGGFSLAGSTINGTGNNQANAKLKFFKNDTLRLVVNAKSFQFNQKRISNSNASISFYLKNDSIYHPNIAFTYNVQKKEVSLFKTDDPMTGSPYYNSYHNIDMDFSLLIWNIDDPEVKITMARGATIGKAWFKSVNYFNRTYFLEMQGMDSVHPLYVFKKFSDWYGEDVFPIDILASWLRAPQFKVEHLAVRLSTEGFIFYDTETKIITIKPQLNDYLEAFGGKIDYDVIDFISSTKAPQNNASLNLHNFDLTIYGIPRIFISDSQNVEIRPYGNKIVLKKNRDFNFGGIVHAGLLTFYGNNFTFQYDSFRVHLNNIDSLNLAVVSEKEDIYGKKQIKKLKNIIQNITGELFIDDPDNKSGIKSIPGYPFFRSTTNAFVYYDVTEGLDSTIYPKDQFYYKLNPFEISDMTDLKAEDLNLGGEYYCGNIFPVLKQNLTVQQDNSLGFSFIPPSEGIPAYGGKATFFDSITLSNRGLEGSGKLEYLTSTTQSNLFMFYPDSMIVETARFDMEKDSLTKKFPHALAFDLLVKWYPQEDQFFALRKEEDISIFKDQIFYSGDLLLNPAGLTGDGGELKIGEAEISSGLFNFGDIYFHCDTADIKFREKQAPDDYLVANDFIADMNIEEQGIFTSQIDTVPIYFPEKQYISSSDQFVWDLQANVITLINKDKRNDIYKLNSIITESQWENIPSYVSLDPITDTLGFASDTTILSLDDHTLLATNIKSLEIADIQILPYDKTLTLEKNGHLKGFTNARVIANKAHEIEADTIVVVSKNDYYGSGYYVYRDMDNNPERILFSQIKLNENGHTFATGYIARADSFYLNPWFTFEGMVSLDAEKRYLNFSGGTHVVQSCEYMEPSYISFEAEIDPKDVRIPIPNPTLSIQGKTIYKGIYITHDSPQIYSAFFTKRKNYSDEPIVSAEGYMIYDKQKGQYKITSAQKIIDPSQPGNILTYDNNYCIESGMGILNLGLKMPHLNFTTAGGITHNLENNTVLLDLILGIDFFFSEDALVEMAGQIHSVPSLKTADTKREAYAEGLSALKGKSEKAEPEEDKMVLVLTLDVPAELRHTLLFSELKLKWNEESASYQSVGKIGIGNIFGSPLNRKVDGFIEIQKRGSGDIIDIFLQVDQRTWYYFGYAGSRMQVASSNRDFEDIVANLSEGKRRLKSRGTESSYSYMIASDRKVSNFRRRMRLLQEESDTEETGK
jgi:hypothetical protein